MGGGKSKTHEPNVVVAAPVALATVTVPAKTSDETPTDWEQAAANGLTVASAEAWQEAGFDPETALDYTIAGIGDPDHALEWQKYDFDPEGAGKWADEDFEAPTAHVWDSAGFTPATASGWASGGYDPDEASEFAELGLQPVEALAAQESGKSAIQLVTDHMEAAIGKSDGAAGVLPEPDGEEASGDAAEADEPTPKPELFSDVGAGTTLADAGAVSEQAWDEAVTPVPESLPVGDPRGVPVLMGGDDIVGGSATLIAYADGGGGSPHQVLFTTVTEEAEVKLLEALAPTEEKLVPVEVEKTKSGRLKVDTQSQIFEELTTAAKSVNHHLKDASTMPPHTVDRIGKLHDLFVNQADELTADPTSAAMYAHYEPFVTELQKRIAPDFATPYDQGGKVGWIAAFETTWTETETEWVPDTSEPTGSEKLAAAARAASRVNPTLADGIAQWDGKNRAPAKGTEYSIELGQGYRAVYHPYTYAKQNLGQDHYSLRGQLELHAPPNGSAKDMVDVLGSLNIVNRPMNGAESEWVYLRRNIEAQGLESHPAVANAVAKSAQLEDAVSHTLLTKHAPEAQGMSEQEINQLAHRLTLEAEVAALPLRVRVVRDAVASAAGFGSGKELVEDPSYDPKPRRSGGWMVFNRFDVAKRADTLRPSFSGKSLRCHITGGNSGGASLASIFKNGGMLASTERRRMMGVPQGSGMSEQADMVSGGAQAVFLRVGPHSNSGEPPPWSGTTRSPSCSAPTGTPTRATTSAPSTRARATPHRGWSRTPARWPISPAAATRSCSETVSTSWGRMRPRKSCAPRPASATPSVPT